MSSAAPSVAILGGGLAGLITAFELAKRGLRPKVIEAGPRCGGRTSSWRDDRARHVDTGLHVVADHYHNLLDVLREVGAAQLRWWSVHYHLRRHGNPMRCRYSQLRSPWHLLAPALEMPVSAADRYRLWRAASRLKHVRQADLDALDDITYMDWHRMQRLRSPILWDTACVASDAATFLGPEEASARAILSWLMYMSRSAKAADIGTWQGPLNDCLVEPLLNAIRHHGGEIVTSAAVTALEWDGRRITGVRLASSKQTRPVYSKDGRVDVEPGGTWTLAADYYVSALPVQSLRRVLSNEQIAAAGLVDALTLQVVPAISLTAWLDRPVECVPPGAPLVSGYSMRDLIDLNSLWEPRFGLSTDDRAVYQFVLARAERYENVDDATLVRCVFEDLKHVWPATRFARVEGYTVERIPGAMFAARPGAQRRRPSAETALDNLFLAGDWTRHHRNASMEGAATSGRRAANVVLQRVGAPLLTIHPAPELEWPTLAAVRAGTSPGSGVSVGAV